MSHWAMKRIPILSLVLLLGIPGQSGLRCSSNQWPLLKELEVLWRKPNDRDPPGVGDITIKMPVATAQDLKGKMETEITKHPKSGQEGANQNQIQCYNYQEWGHMWHKCFSTQNTRPLNSRIEINSRTSPYPQTECRGLHQPWHQTPANRNCYQLPIL